VQPLVISWHLVRLLCYFLLLASPPPAVTYVNSCHFCLVLLRRFTDSPFRSIACARDHQISRRLPPDYSVAEYGLGSTPKICVFTDRHHASIEKAAAIVGIGRANVISLPPKGFVEELKERLTRCEEKGEGAVVVLSFGEVNTVRDPIREQSRILRHWKTTVGASKGRIYARRQTDSTTLRPIWGLVAYRCRSGRWFKTQTT